MGGRGAGKILGPPFAFFWWVLKGDDRRREVEGWGRRGVDLGGSTENS